MPHFSLRTKLVLSFSIVIIVGVFLSAFVGIRLIGDTILRQVQDKVRLDLNTAREVYQGKSEFVKNVVRLTAARPFMKDAIIKNDVGTLKAELQKIMKNEFLDVLTLTDNNGRVLLRGSGSEIYGDQLKNEIVNRALTKKQVVVTTKIISKEELEKEGEDLIKQARIKFIPTTKARPLTSIEETSGMMLEAAAPVFGYNGELIGLLYGGKLLNRNYEIVDKVKDIVYRGEQYKGKDTGTATIFQGDLRISTNVRNADGTRAIGTRVSKEVYDQVILKGIPWIGRAFVVNAWYRTAYEPIRNINDEIIGMLYIGILEAPYVDLKNRVIFIFLSIAFLSVILLSIIAYITAANIIKPINELVIATRKVAQGDLSHRIKIKPHDEIGQLADSFNSMTAELQKATEGYLSLTKTLEDKVEEKTKKLKEAQNLIIQSEKLTSMGKLAAGIAHEINNPLTSILINSSLISEKSGEDYRSKENVKLIIDETARCSKIVKGLLEFARQTQPEMRFADLNDVIEKTLLLFRSQMLVNNVMIDKKLDKKLPLLMIDINKLEQVFTNIILNALEAMSEGGLLSIRSKVSENGKFVEVNIGDKGCGIAKESINKIFDPFFTTKGIKGNGLGLSVSYGIVQQHNGSINVESEVGKGTIFTIRFPIKES